jgi:hypothetical protein
MPNKIVPDLVPNKRYKIRYRSYNADGERGAWSPIYTIDSPLSLGNVNLKDPSVIAEASKYVATVTPDIASIIGNSIGTTSGKVQIKWYWKFYEIAEQNSGLTTNLSYHIIIPTETKTYLLPDGTPVLDEFGNPQTYESTKDVRLEYVDYEVVKNP